MDFPMLNETCIPGINPIGHDVLLFLYIAGIDFLRFLKDF